MRSTRIVRVTAILLALAACSTAATQTATDGDAAVAASPSEYLESLAGSKSSLVDQILKTGIEALEAGELKTASKSFNHALKLELANGGLHFLNAMTYHLMAARGDSSQLEYARVGYELSLQFEPSLHWAAYQLGVIEFGDQSYAAAQNWFAYAALYDPKSLEILAGLAAASYYAQDIPAAIAAIDRLLELRPLHAATLRAAAMIYGAAGRLEKAAEFARAHETLEMDQPFRIQRLNRRLKDWMNVHLTEDGATAPRRPGNTQLAQQGGSDVLGTDSATEGLPAPTDSGGSGSSGFGTDTSSSSTTSTTTPAKPPRMTLIDVAIIRSEERATTSKGLNLLSGLQLTFAGTILSYQFNRTHDLIGAGAVKTKQISQSASFTIPALTYSLNIFNDNNDSNEVLARPTLVALDGKASDFFSGAVWHVEIAGGTASSSSVEDIPIGIKLSVTPQFLSDDKVILNVSAARAFIEAPSAQGGFTAFSQTTKTEVTANVVMDFDQTLVLSGLSEKETEVLKDGVPLLQDLPGIQYLFSNQTTVDLNKSVLILLTPRKPQFTYLNGVPKIDPDKKATADEGSTQAIDRLKADPAWNFKPAPTLDAVIRHLDGARFFKEFRTGDVALEKWDDLDSLRYKINQIIEFLYY